MAAQIVCANPACARKLGIPDGASGMKIQCPYCKQVFLVPPANIAIPVALPAMLTPTSERQVTAPSTANSAATGYIWDRRFMLGAVVGSAFTAILLGLFAGSLFLLRSSGDANRDLRVSEDQPTLAEVLEQQQRKAAEAQAKLDRAKMLEQEQRKAAEAQAKLDRAKMDIKSLETVVMVYMTRHGNFPQTLDELLVRDPVDGTPAPLTERGSVDPWNQRYIYEPGSLHPQNGKPLIYSLGPPDSQKRISNWESDTVFHNAKFGKTDDLPASPAKVLANISGMTPENQEKVVLSLGRYDLKDPRAYEAITVLRKMVKNSSMSPPGRAAAIHVLGAKKDYQSLTDIAECLYQDDDKDFVVRKAAVEFCNHVMGINLGYDPAGPPDERKRVADEYMANAKLWQKMKGVDKASK